MKTLALFLLLISSVAFGQLPTYSTYNVKTYFDTASVATIDTFAVHASVDYTSAWQNRFDFTGKQIFLNEITLVPTSEKNYFVATLGHLSYSKANPSLRNYTAIDYSGFSLTSDGDNSSTLAKIDTKIHTDWVVLPVAPFFILASFWITKDVKK